MKHKGVGIHCFAGGFTMGMKRVLPVVGQLEIHNFGRETCDAHGTKFMNADTWQGWSEYKKIWNGCSFCYGNPRCTSFSSYSSGAGKDARGPFAKPTQDIMDLCQFGIKAGFDLIAFESVQQAYSVGLPLINYLKEDLFFPNHYRIAHLFVNTAAEGNAQRRRRYFFVAYRDNKNFNVMLPELPKYQMTVGDVIKPLLKRKTKEGKLGGSTNVDYTANTYVKLTPIERRIVPHLKQGESFNSFARKRENELEKICPESYEKWLTRTSEIPFSLHCPTKTKWDGACPTIASTSVRLIHPTLPRPLTVGELAALMGWPKGFIPVGPEPVGQIGKGVVPATGEWLGEQIKMYLDDYWGDEDFESGYSKQHDCFIGHTFTKTDRPLEKEFRLTQYVPELKGAKNV